jgi:hypothetical protein
VPAKPPWQRHRARHPSATSRGGVTTDPALIWQNLDRFDLTEGAQPVILDRYDASRAGEVSERFSGLASTRF